MCKTSFLIITLSKTSLDTESGVQLPDLQIKIRKYTYAVRVC